MRELSVAEQRYRAVLAVIKDGRTVTETAAVQLPDEIRTANAALSTLRSIASS